METLKAYILDKNKNSLASFLMLIFVLLSIAGIHRLALVSDYRIFFSEDNPELNTFLSLQRLYSNSDNVLLVVKPPSQTIYNGDTINLIHDITKEAWLLPYAVRVNSLTNYPHTYADGDDIYIEEFISRKEQINTERIRYIKKEAKQEEDLLNQLITPSGSLAAIDIIIRLPGKNNKKEVSDVAENVRQLVAKIESEYPDHKIYMSGIIMMNNAFFEAARGDFITLIPIMVLVILIAAGVILRTKSGAIAISLVVIGSVLAALGLAGWLGIPLSAPSVSAPIILLTIIVASNIHILSSLQQEMINGNDVESALYKSVDKNYIPVLLTNVTTLIGFLAMNFSESPPFRDLGNIVAIGVVVSWCLSMTIVPFVIRRFPSKAASSLANSFSLRMPQFSDFTRRHRTVIIMFLLPVSLSLTLLSFTNELNDDFVKYFDESVEFREHTEYINSNFTGIYSIEFSIETKHDNEIFQPNVLSFTDKFFVWLKKQPEIISVTSIINTLKNINQNMHGGKMEFYHLPESKEIAVQYFTLYEMSLPFGMDMNDKVNIKKSATRMVARLENMSTKELLALEKRVEHWLSKNKPDLVTINYSSPTVMFSHIGQRSIESLLKGAVLALLLISAILAFVFKSIRIGVVSILPNLLPAGLGYGVWALSVGQISMGLAGVSAMTIGIVVDDIVPVIA